MTPPVSYSILSILSIVDHFDGMQLVGHRSTCLDVEKKHSDNEVRAEGQIVGPDGVASLFSIVNDLRKSWLVLRLNRLHLIQTGPAPWFV